jgi:hypothetical protein
MAYRALLLIAGRCWSQFWSRNPGPTGVDQGIHTLQLNHDGVLLHLLAAPLLSRAFRPPPLTVGSYRSLNIRVIFAYIPVELGRHPW